MLYPKNMLILKKKHPCFFCASLPPQQLPNVHANGPSGYFSVLGFLCVTSILSPKQATFEINTATQTNWIQVGFQLLLIGNVAKKLKINTGIVGSQCISIAV